MLPNADRACNDQPPPSSIADAVPLAQVDWDARRRENQDVMVALDGEKSDLLVDFEP